MSNEILTLHPKEGIELLAIEVPEDAKEFRVDNKSGWITYYHNDNGDTKYFGPLIDLPPGNYSFIATSKTITEEQAAELVEKVSIGYYNDYENDVDLYVSPVLSLFSLIRSAGGDLDKHTYAILKKQ